MALLVLTTVNAGSLVPVTMLPASAGRGGRGR